MTGITTPTQEALIPGMNMTASQLVEQKRQMAQSREAQKARVEAAMAQRKLDTERELSASPLAGTKLDPRVRAMMPDMFSQQTNLNMNPVLQQNAFQPLGVDTVDALKAKGHTPEAYNNPAFASLLGGINKGDIKFAQSGGNIKNLEKAIASGKPFQYIQDNWGLFGNWLNFEDTGISQEFNTEQLDALAPEQQSEIFKRLIEQKKVSGSMFQDNPLGTLALAAGLAFGGLGLAGALGGGGGAAASGIAKGAAAGGKAAAGAAKAGGGFFKSLLPSFGKGSGILGKVGSAGQIADFAGKATGNEALSKLGNLASTIGGGNPFTKSGGVNIAQGDDVGLFSKIGNFLGWEQGAGVGSNLGNIFGGLFKNDEGGTDWTNILAAMGAGSAAAGGNDLSDLLGFTNRDLQNQLRGAEFIAPGVNLAGGVGSQYDPSTNSFSSSLGDLNPLRNLILGTAGQERPDAAIQTALRDFGLGSFQDTGDIEAQQLALLRERAAPDQQRRGNAALQQLFNRGQFGQGSSQTGEVARGLAEAQNQEDLGFQLAARDLGLRTQAQRYGQGVQALGLGDQLQTSSLQRLLSGAGGAMDFTKLSSLPIELQLALGSARSNANLGVGTNLVRSSANQNSLGDLLGLWMQSGGTGGATVNV
jgi:hypothetical protein